MDWALGSDDDDAAVLNVRIPEERVVAASRQCCLDSVMQGCSVQRYNTCIKDLFDSFYSCRKVFQYLYIPIMSKCIDEIRSEYNSMDKRSQHKRTLPSGYLSQPLNLMEHPEEFGGSADLKVKVPEGYLIEKMQQLEAEGDFEMFSEDITRLLRGARRRYADETKSLHDVWPVLQKMVGYLRDNNLTGPLEQFEDVDDHEDRSNAAYDNIVFF
ncbi:hypothetical protein BDR26DRAFT_61187 [Obelidium mucronatum]|nr:hypothetical protein BDR26DRAFT_61187 [Obelidium mucronatum]